MGRPTITIRGSTQPKTWHRDVRYRCILLQLGAGITYCAAAEIAVNQYIHSANIEYAMRAYSTAADWTRDTKLTARMRGRVQERAAELQKLLNRTQDRYWYRFGSRKQSDGRTGGTLLPQRPRFIAISFDMTSIGLLPRFGRWQTFTHTKSKP